MKRKLTVALAALALIALWGGAFAAGQDDAVLVVSGPARIELSPDARVLVVSVDRSTDDGLVDAFSIGAEEPLALPWGSRFSGPVEAVYRRSRLELKVGSSLVAFSVIDRDAMPRAETERRFDIVALVHYPDVRGSLESVTRRYLSDDQRPIRRRGERLLPDPGPCRAASTAVCARPLSC